MLSCDHSGLFHEVHDFKVSSFPVFPVQIKPLALRPVKVSEDETVQELNRPHRSNSKEQLSEVSPRTRPFPFSKTPYREPGYPLSQAKAGDPRVGI